MEVAPGGVYDAAVMSISRRSFLAGIGSATVGLLFRRRLEAVLDSLERDAATELVAEPATPDQLPSAIEITVEPQMAFRPERLAIPGIVVGRETVPETRWEPCSACDGSGDGDGATFCEVCDGARGELVPTGALVERDVKVIPWVIENITIGDAPQLAGEAPGDLFSADSADSQFMMNVAAPGMPIRFRVRYVGDDPAGARFRAAIFGNCPMGDGRRRLAVLPLDSGCAIVA